MKVCLLAAILLIACTTTQEGSDTTTKEASDSPTLRLSSGEAVAIVQESLTTKEPPGATRAAGLETCWGYVVILAENWTAALNRTTVPSFRSPGSQEYTGQSHWRVVATVAPRLGDEWVWRLYPSGLVEIVEGPC